MPIKGHAAVVVTSTIGGAGRPLHHKSDLALTNVGEFRMMFNTILNYQNLETGKSNTPTKPTRDSKDTKDKDTKEETPDPAPAY